MPEKLGVGGVIGLAMKWQNGLLLSLFYVLTTGSACHISNCVSPFAFNICYLHDVSRRAATPAVPSFPCYSLSLDRLSGPISLSLWFTLLFALVLQEHHPVFRSP